MNKEQKQKERRIQKIVNMLLDEGMTADDVAKTREDKKGPLETFTEAFERRYKKESFKINGRVMPSEDMKEYCAYIDSFSSKVANIPLAKRVSMSDIQSDLNKYLNTTWKDLSYEQKLNVLWEYGLNVLKESEDSSKYWVTRCIHRNRNNQVVDGLCIIASERTDKEWIMTPMASYEAKVYTKDVEMMRDIDRMGAY